VLHHFLEGKDKGMYLAPDRIVDTEVGDGTSFPWWAPLWQFCLQLEYFRSCMSANAFLLLKFLLL
jgi:hypothetical protein